MKTYLNCLGVTTFNMSQYNTGKKYKFNPMISDKGFMTIKKPEIKIDKYANKFSDISFYKSCEYYPCLIPLNIKSFYKEGFFDFYKKIFGDNNSTNNKRNLDENNKNNIQIYFKKKEKKKLFEENEDENTNNKNEIIKDKENFSSPKSIQMRNIPEEDRKAMETMFNDDDDFEDQEDIIDDD